MSSDHSSGLVGRTNPTCRRSLVVLGRICFSSSRPIGKFSFLSDTGWAWSVTQTVSQFWSNSLNVEVEHGFHIAVFRFDIEVGRFLAIFQLEVAGSLL